MGKAEGDMISVQAMYRVDDAWMPNNQCDGYIGTVKCILT